MIVADGLTKAYGKHLAVNHVSFKVGQGEIFGFLGPNGAGKTTTIKMLNTLLKVSEGKAFINGLDVAKEPNEIRKIVGLVPQDLTLDRDMTGRQNMRIQSTLYEVPQEVARRKSDELFRLVDLHAVADNEVGTYSWGMQKRLELIMGLIQTPRVLFLDEPTLGLDAQSRSLIWDYIRKLNTDYGVTVFMTTHYLEEADELCHRIAIIDEGIIKIEGSPEQLKDSLGGETITLRLSKPVKDIGFEVLLHRIQGVVKVSGEGVSCYVQTTRSEAIIPKLILALSAEAEVESVSVSKTDLNQVFLKHTAKSLATGDPEDEFRMLSRERLLKERT